MQSSCELEQSSSGAQTSSYFNFTQNKCELGQSVCKVCAAKLATSAERLHRVCVPQSSRGICSKLKQRLAPQSVSHETNSMSTLAAPGGRHRFACTHGAGSNKRLTCAAAVPHRRRAFAYRCAALGLRAATEVSWRELGA